MPYVSALLAILAILATFALRAPGYTDALPVSRFPCGCGSNRDLADVDSNDKLSQSPRPFSHTSSPEPCLSTTGYSKAQINRIAVKSSQTASSKPDFSIGTSGYGETPASLINALHAHPTTSQDKTSADNDQKHLAGYSWLKHVERKVFPVPDVLLDDLTKLRDRLSYIDSFFHVIYNTAQRSQVTYSSSKVQEQLTMLDETMQFRWQPHAHQIMNIASWFPKKDERRDKFLWEVNRIHNFVSYVAVPAVKAYSNELCTILNNLMPSSQSPDDGDGPSSDERKALLSEAAHLAQKIRLIFTDMDFGARFIICWFNEINHPGKACLRDLTEKRVRDLDAWSIGAHRPGTENV